MDAATVKSYALSFLKKWGWSLVLLPFIAYSLHQAYWTLNYNIFFAISYDFPFPVNLVHIFLSNFLLTVHEAGHTLFGLLGWRILTYLGGGLMQLIIPGLILTYCLANRRRTGIQCSLYLTGLSFIDIAFYAADGGARQLPLIGNLPKANHDWYNILVYFDALAHDSTIALMLCITGACCYAMALLLPAFFTRYRRVNLDIDI